MSNKSGIGNAYQSQRSEVLKLFLKGDLPVFPFNEKALDLGKGLNLVADQKVKLERFFSFGINASQKYLKHLAELDVAIAELLEQRDERLFNFTQWLEIYRNPFFDVGIAGTDNHVAALPETAQRARMAFFRDYDQQIHPYVTNDGQSIPVTFISGYLNQINESIPSFLGPGHDLREMIGHRARIIGKRSQVTEEKNQSELLEELIAHPNPEIPSIREAQDFKAEVLGMLNQFRPFLDTLRNLYDRFVFDFAESKPQNASRKIIAALQQIRAWEWKEDSVHEVLDKEALDEIIKKVPFPPAFRKYWLPILETMKWFDRLSVEWEKADKMYFRDRMRLAENYSAMSASLADNIKAATSLFLNDRSKRQKSIEAAMLPLNLYRRFTGNSAASYEQLFATLLEITLMVNEFEFDIVRLAEFFKKNPMQHHLPAYSIDEGEHEYLKSELKVMVQNMELLPVAFKRVAEIEQQILDVYEGRVEIKREFNFRQILTNILVPRQGWLKTYAKYLQDLNGKPVSPQQKMHTVLKEKIYDTVFQSGDFPVSGEVQQELETMRNELEILAPESMPSLEGTLKRYLAIKNPSKEAQKVIERNQFLNNHEQHLCEALLRHYQNNPDHFIVEFAKSYLQPRIQGWRFKIHDNQKEDHFFESISDLDFENMVSLCNRFDEGDMNKEFRQKAQAIRDQVKAETDKLAEKILEERASQGSVFTFAEQDKFLRMRREMERKKIEEMEAQLEEEQSQSQVENSESISINALLKRIKTYIRPQLFWTKELFELSLIRRFTIKDQPQIIENSFRMAAYYLRRIRRTIRFDEKDLKDPRLIKHIWPYTPITFLRHKKELPDLDTKYLVQREDENKRELDPIHTPENIKAVIHMVEIMHPELFNRKRGAHFNIGEPSRRFDLNPIRVILTPPGVRSMREIPTSPKLFPNSRGKSLGNIVRSAFNSREYKQDPDYIYSPVYFDSRNRTLIISADADDTNLFYYLSTPEHWETARNVFSSIFMGLGMVVFSQLPQYFQSGDYGDNTNAWTTCLLQARANERNYYIKKNTETNGLRDLAAQTSGLVYQVPTDQMSNDYYLIELEFATYYSEIMLELLTGKVRNPNRPSIVDNWFHKTLKIVTYRHIQSLFQKQVTDDPRYQQYQDRFQQAQQFLHQFLQIRSNEKPQWMPGYGPTSSELMRVATGHDPDLKDQMAIVHTEVQRKRHEHLSNLLADLELFLLKQNPQELSRLLNEIDDEGIKNKLKLFSNKSNPKIAALLYFVLAAETHENVTRHVIKILVPLDEQERISVVKQYLAILARPDFEKAFVGMSEYLKKWEDGILGPVHQQKIKQFFHRISTVLN